MSIPSPEEQQRQLQQIQRELSYIEQQLSSMEQQRGQYIEYVNEVMTTINTLKGLDDPMNSNTSLMPLPGNVYLRAKITPYDTVLVNVGADVVIPKPIKEAIEILEEKVNNLREVIKKIEEEMEKAQSTAIQMKQILANQNNFGVAPDPNSY